MERRILYNLNDGPIGFTLSDDPIRFDLNAITEAPDIDGMRLLEDGSYRLLEDGSYRLLENG